KTCPFLIRVFVKSGSHHELDRDFQLPDRLPSKDESQIYAWFDTTLREICLQLLDSSPSLMSNPPIKFSIRSVFLDVPRHSSVSHDGPIPRYKAQDIGTIYSRDLARSASIPTSSGRSLQDLRFVVGDFIDIALISSNAPPAAAASSSPVDQRPSFGIRGASSRAAGGQSSNSREGPRWGRSSGPSPRWGSSKDRRGSGGAFEQSRSSNHGRWGQSSGAHQERTNGGADRDGDRYRDRGGKGKWASSATRKRRDSRSRSPSPARRRR
ncbi:Sin3 associated polypeptide p18-domain-containing protein, partial [Phakopsora pachyrhizi]